MLRDGTENGTDRGLSNNRPLHADAVAEDVPLRGVAIGVVAEHAGRILADEQVVVSVTVVISRAAPSAIQ